jgi:hypothetical protein
MAAQHLAALQTQPAPLEVMESLAAVGALVQAHKAAKAEAVHKLRLRLLRASEAK